MRATGKSREEVFGALTTLPAPQPRVPTPRRSAAMAKMKAGDDDNDTSNDELIARARGGARERRRRGGGGRADAEAKDAAVMEEIAANDPWRQAEFEWDTVESRELKEGPAKGKVGLKR